ncbi:hypothetical protein B0H19DRAFT_1254687 [Mycena capillaripes]|nr:hypothetical protein B0H19DRAFT_1254687 [Mycena capillaripes]
MHSNTLAFWISDIYGQIFVESETSVLTAPPTNHGLAPTAGAGSSVQQDKGLAPSTFASNTGAGRADIPTVSSGPVPRPPPAMTAGPMPSAPAALRKPQAASAGTGGGTMSASHTGAGTAKVATVSSASTPSGPCQPHVGLNAGNTGPNIIIPRPPPATTAKPMPGAPAAPRKPPAASASNTSTGDGTVSASSTGAGTAKAAAVGTDPPSILSASLPSGPGPSQPHIGPSASATTAGTPRRHIVIGGSKEEKV